MSGTPAPKVQYLNAVEDIDRITFADGLAAVEVPIALIDALPLANEIRDDDPRGKALERAIRARGYASLDPIICRIGMKGRWVVVDGGHRISAARKVAREFWTNLLWPKVRTLYFLLFTTEGSWSKVKRVADELKAESAVPTLPAPDTEPPAGGA